MLRAALQPAGQGPGRGDHRGGIPPRMPGRRGTGQAADRSLRTRISLREFLRGWQEAALRVQNGAD